MADAAIDLLAGLLDKAKRNGADAADALLVESGGQSAAWRLGKLEKVEREESRDLGLRVFIGHRQAILSTADLSPDGLERLVERAVTIARAVPEDKYAGLAAPDEIARDVQALDLDDGVEPSGERLAEQAAEAEAAAREVSGITNSEGAEAGWSRTRMTLAASNGFTGETARSRHSLSVSVIAGKNGTMERDYDFSSKVRAAELPEPAEVGRKAAQRAVRRLGARKVRSQSVPVVFDPRVAGGVVRHLVSAISGPAVARGTTFLKDRMGDQVFASGIRIVDDPFRPDGLRSRSFDAEGFKGERRYLVDDGRLTTWLLDLASARQLGLASTGHAARGVGSAPSPAPTNTWLEPGEPTPEELIREVGTGFYVTEMLGMGISYVTGDYSRGAAGFWIEGGELAYPVSEVTIAGTLQDIFLHLTPANDLEFRYGIDAPTLRIDGLTVAGQ
ncbi:MAG: TldD/PmbA family protein [Geminicoccaceae bacterium]|nr:TldD/PmbA family protein [Geminicoccaceae bacterium]